MERNSNYFFCNSVTLSQRQISHRELCQVDIGRHVTLSRGQQCNETYVIPDLCGNEWDVEHRFPKPKLSRRRMGQFSILNKKKNNLSQINYFYHHSHDQLKANLHAIAMTCNVARWLKRSKILPWECICKIWTKEPERFNVDLFSISEVIQ